MTLTFVDEIVDNIDFFLFAFGAIIDLNFIVVSIVIIVIFVFIGILRVVRIVTFVRRLNSIFLIAFLIVLI